MNQLLPVPNVAAAIVEIATVLGTRVTTHAGLRDAHCERSTWLTPQPPDAVAFAQSVADVQAVVRACVRHRVPIIPFGTGTSIEGQINAPHGGISLDLSGMDRILAVNAGDGDCTVEPGVTRLRLNAHLRDTGLFFPIDPGADASLCGMAATRASGTNAVRYGTMRENVVALTAVLPDGEVIQTGSRARKSAAGYDLTRLLVGSAGTLAVITSVTLRLHPIPEQVAAGICAFASLDGACQAASEAIGAGIPLARIELLDATMVRMCNAYSKLNLREAPTLFVECHGSPAAVEEQMALFGAIAEGHGAMDFAAVTDPAERTRLWRARHEASSACRAWRPGSDFLGTDACVPITRLAACVAATMADLAALGLVGAATGHVGDGNFHVAVLVDSASPAERHNAHEFTRRLALRAIAMEGTCTGEHGIGQGKIAYLEVEAATALGAMRRIKQAFDPLNIMNPGKIFSMPGPA